MYAICLANIALDYINDANDTIFFVSDDMDMINHVISYLETLSPDSDILCSITLGCCRDHPLNTLFQVIEINGDDYYCEPDFIYPEGIINGKNSLHEQREYNDVWFVAAELQHFRVEFNENII